MKTYDPNMVWAVQAVRLTYQMWDYSAEFEVLIRGNCKGASVLKAGISRHADQLYDEQGEYAVLVLKRPAEDGNGEDTLECDADEESLEEMCIGARITSQTPLEKTPATQEPRHD